MNADARALSLFRAYLDADPSRRRGLLERARRSDPQAHALLAAMIAADRSRHPLDRPLPPPRIAAATAADDQEGEERIGTRLGPWRIVRKIGRGGMGIVYEAHRDDRQYDQRVALKCARSGLSSPHLAQALVSERHHLARLQHPGITALLDGGLDPDGHPWFALQYVDGEPIDTWCDRQRKTLRERVALLRQICAALAYAHGQGVLHRDIKPSNLLVTASARVQLLDFGLAVPLAADADASAPFALTPGYTAPEIVFQGAAPSVASDLYSLGIVAARLLAGDAPHRSVLGQASRWLESAPADRDWLSRAAAEAGAKAARDRGLADPAALAKAVAGDLAAIVGRCTDPEPARRYRDADELDADLGRWLQQRPVRARGDDPWYRAGRHLRRLRLPLGLAVLAALAAAIGAGATVWQGHRARDEARAAVAVGRLFEETLGSATLSGLGETRFSSGALLRDVEAKVRALDLASQPQVLARALTSLARSQAVVGDYAQATRLADESARLLQRSDAPAAESQATLASLLNLQARHADARRVAQQALQELDGSAADRPLRVRLLSEIARSDWELDAHQSARRVLDQALALTDRGPQADPAPYAELLILRGHWNARLLSLPAAEADLRRAIAVSAGPHPQLANQAREKLVRVLTLQERFPQAETLAQRLLDERRRTLGEGHPDTGRAWVALADNRCAGDRPEECSSAIERGKAILRESYGDAHPEYAEALRVSTQLYFLDEGSYLQRLDEMRRAEAILRSAYGAQHEAALRARADLGVMLLHRKPESLDAALAQRLRAEGLSVLSQAIPRAERKRIPLFAPKLYYARALGERRLDGDQADALRLLNEVEQDVGRHFGATHSLRFRVPYSIASVEYDAGDLVAAERRLAAVQPLVEAALPRIRARLVLCNLLRLRAQIAADSGQRQRAEAFLIARRDAAERWLGAQHSFTRQAHRELEAFARTGRVVWHRA